MVLPCAACTEIGGGESATLTPNFLSELRLKVDDVQRELYFTGHVGRTDTVPVATIDKENPHFFPTPIIKKKKKSKERSCNSASSPSRKMNRFSSMPTHRMGGF